MSHTKKPPLKVTFKWSRGDTVLLPALSGVVKTFILTVQRYEIKQYPPNFLQTIFLFR